MMFQIKVGSNWVDLPEPAKEGLAITREPIWGTNTGRSASGKMTGDIITHKTTIAVTWPPLSAADTATILDAVEGAGSFFDIRFTNDVGSGTATYTVYASNLPRTVYSLAPGLAFRHTGIEITFIEQ